MYISLRLYSPYDNDLIFLRSRHKRGFQQIVRNCLASAFYGEPFVISFETNCSCFQIPSSKEIRVGLYLNDTEMKDIVSTLQDFEPGSVSALIKSSIRACFSRFPLELYSLKNTPAVTGLPVYSETSLFEKKDPRERIISPKTVRKEDEPDNRALPSRAESKRDALPDTFDQKTSLLKEDALSGQGHASSVTFSHPIESLPDPEPEDEIDDILNGLMG